MEIKFQKFLFSITNVFFFSFEFFIIYFQNT